MPLPSPTEQQSRIIWLALTGLALASLLALVVALIWGLNYVLQLLSPVLWPLAVAGVLAYLLDPVVDLLEKRGSTRPRAIICVFGMALIIVFALFGSVVPQLINETRELANRIPLYAVNVERRIEHWVSKPPAFVRKLLEREQRAKAAEAATLTNEAGPFISSNVPPTAASSVSNAPPFLV